MAASEHGFSGIVTALLAAGAKPELADKQGRTALAHVCVKLGNMEVDTISMSDHPHMLAYKATFPHHTCDVCRKARSDAGT